MNLDIATLTAAIAALIGSLVAIGKLSLDKRKATDDASTAIVHSAAELVDDLRQEIRRLRIERQEKDKIIEEQQVKILKLELQVHQAYERITALESRIEEIEENNGWYEKKK